MYIMNILLCMAIIAVVLFIIVEAISLYEKVTDMVHNKNQKINLLEANQVELNFKQLELDRLQVEAIKIDRDSYEIYSKELDKLIEMYTVFKVDEVVGNKFRDTKSIKVIIETEDILDIVGYVGNKIVKNIKGTPMHIFLYQYFGRDTIQLYISNKSMAIAINYYKNKKIEIEQQMSR